MTTTEKETPMESGSPSLSLRIWKVHMYPEGQGASGEMIGCETDQVEQDPGDEEGTPDEHEQIDRWHGNTSDSKRIVGDK